MSLLLAVTRVIVSRCTAVLCRHGSQELQFWCSPVQLLLLVVSQPGRRHACASSGWWWWNLPPPAFPSAMSPQHKFPAALVPEFLPAGQFVVVPAEGRGRLLCCCFHRYQLLCNDNSLTDSSSFDSYPRIYCAQKAVDCPGDAVSRLLLSSQDKP
ncbi:hypothetical protein MPTK1_5g20340 [Marchantia polymorpha subsp. ruderalis]|uniref:Secreted protein n=2 Tax=Marchantia polymorpha TaxID=3197 RepID=A0AAF6BKD3_MARPO|nr:hypothetical protein MARPO_0058s0012 [Marchantia polymorpha]BBN12467.1 hypothetical protein Mp_5g20340 [Marchantia polymorpha subsp. ruderalis]|eukprot:PTQ37220.1 hypothetical protein MARPO_0058s0012 [Marchantia polymorpha]